MKITLRPSSILKILLSFIGILLIGHLITVALRLTAEHQIIRGLGILLDFDSEANIPTVYSTFQLLCCSGLLFFIFMNETYGPKWFQSVWLLLSIVFLFLACDEIVGIHERLTPIVRERYSASGLLYFGWMVPYGIGITILGFTLIPFLLRLPGKISLRFLLAGLIFISGAMGFNALGGREVEENGFSTVWYAVFYTFEELFEMIGIAIFIYALLTYITEHMAFQKITLKIRRD